MLPTAHLELDYEAVIGSAQKLRHIFAREDSWPADDMTREEDLVDLMRHEKEFELRLAFAFTVLSPIRDRCLGCVYVNPATKAAYAAEVLLWAVSHGMSDESARSLDSALEHSVREWIGSAWSFTSAVAFPGRDQSWDEWDTLQWRGEAVPRIAEDAQTIVMYDARACGLAL
eukprot:CAMPEP_0183334966 /NCGR_PEP_ID=MMETSP0164_2-20130417/3405_1 /TAXON_ID=221442 /ORGANISM="Coccolithus pelagicus ssp braarudi, Strain PLY182g" /LENGTH=171 /DNA_ID=CAMNT_0025504215 /DNA_START=158 /DNA_END=673 /DNA_ORIENTATION=-